MTDHDTLAAVLRDALYRANLELDALRREAHGSDCHLDTPCEARFAIQQANRALNMMYAAGVRVTTGDARLLEAAQAVAREMTAVSLLRSIERHSGDPGSRWAATQALSALTGATPEAGSREAALRAVAEIVRRHTHWRQTAMTYHAGPDPEHDCLLCRALVDAGVLTLDGIGSGTRAALAVLAPDAAAPDLRSSAGWLVERWDGNRTVQPDALRADIAVLRDALRNPQALSTLESSQPAIEEADRA